MKYVLLCLLFLRGPATYQIDVNQSTVKWTGYAETGAYAPTGTVRVKSGTLTFRDETPVSGKIVMDMPTLSTSNGEMQTHLKDKDFFDVAVYPEAVFVLSAFKGNLASGSLTIRGITQPVSLPVTITKSGGGMLLKGTLKVDRTQFNIKYNSKSYFQDLGNYAIKNEFDLEISLVCRPV